jgi:hypothetical protein
VSARGIEANPEKIQAILTMGKPTKLHDVQKLAGRVATLSRFVARLGEKALPFYALMKKIKRQVRVDRRSRCSLCTIKETALHTAGVGRTK